MLLRRGPITLPHSKNWQFKRIVQGPGTVAGTELVKVEAALVLGADLFLARLARIQDQDPTMAHSQLVETLDWVLYLVRWCISHS